MFESLTIGVMSDVRRIFWDQTNLNRKTRQKKLEKFDAIPGAQKYRKTAVVFVPNLDLTIERNDLRKPHGRDIPYNVLASMFDSFEMPTKAEGFEYILTVQ
jgi:hypothetical protein